MNIIEYDNGARRISTSGIIEGGKCQSKDRNQVAKIIGLYASGHWQQDLWLFEPGDDLSKMRRYYFGVVVATIQKEIQAKTGDLHESSDIDEMLRQRFFFAEILDPSTGEIIKLRKSISNRSNTDGLDFWENLIDKSRQFAFDLFGVTIPDPNSILQ